MDFARDADALFAACAFVEDLTRWEDADAFAFDEDFDAPAFGDALDEDFEALVFDDTFDDPAFEALAFDDDFFTVLLAFT